MERICVVDLFDKDGNVVGYATGTAQETAAMSKSVWTASGPKQTKVDVLRDAMVARVQELRRSAEANGVTINGNLFATDTGSQVKYVGALLHSSKTSGFTVSWKTMNSGYVTMDSASIAAVCMGVLAYIQACYAWEQTLMQRIETARTVDDLHAIDVLAGRPKGALDSGVSLAPPPTELSGVTLTVTGASTLGTVNASGTVTAGKVTTGTVTVTTAVNCATVTATGAIRGGSLTSGALTATTVTTTGITASRKLRGNGNVPAITRGAASGTTSVVALAAGSTDVAGHISVTPSGAITFTQGTAIATVTFNMVYTTAPFVVVNATGMASGSLVCQPYITSTTTGFSLFVAGMGSLVTGATYTWTYHVIQ